MRVSVVGVAFLSSLVATGWTALAWVLTPCFLLVLLPLPVSLQTKGFYRRTMGVDGSGGAVAWTLAMSSIENLFGIQVKIYGDAATKAHEGEMPQDRALWLSNHRTRIDWMFMWCVALRTRTLHQLRIVLKAPLRKIPIFGWAMQHFIFIFLVRYSLIFAQRRWADDQVSLQKLLPFLTSAEPEASYLIFPEGTDLSESNKVKSIAFAEKNSLPPRQYSLYPRTTGWTFMFPLLRAQLTAVYDVTMFYVDCTANERPSEASLLTGRVPLMIQFYIERVDISTLRDKSEGELAAWMEARFERKEAMLKAFYESDDGKLPAGAEPMFEEDQAPAMAALVAFWVGLVVLTGIFGLIGNVSSLLGAVAVIAGYAASTAYGSGVDGYLVENL
ncbi:hypothetical protein BBJ28_00023862 [Nothophytophthora sp. Chile5]|nr:hypothetical protein BBJ28_00023862 [Nothophytophthora sp. Chile5]